MPTLDWIGKAAVVNHHQEVPYRLLHCDSALSAGESGQGNLLIQGDNLQALKALLPYYAGQVKCIYIDPPYNTGNEFWVYNDNVKAPEIARWLGDVVGKDMEDLSRHDKWLCMMYPRLRLLRQFLREDGVIFVSIDENEIANLRLVMDEIFGKHQNLGTLVWKRRSSSAMRGTPISIDHEYVLLYANDVEQATLHGLAKGVNGYPLHDANGYYASTDLTVGMDNILRPGQFYAVTNPRTGRAYDANPNRVWRFNPETMQKVIEADLIIWPDDVEGSMGRPRYKTYYDPDTIKPRPISSWIDSTSAKGKEITKQELADDVSILTSGMNEEGGRLLQRILGRKTFAYPKPLSLIKSIIRGATSGNDLVLDSFAGSGTTGHAVMQLNKEDGGNRRFILAEMEPNIAQGVTAERLRRVIGGYGETPGLGGGFRYCKLSEPLFNAQGKINDTVTFSDLAHHIYFTETGEPLPQRPDSDTPLIGSANGIAYYLLWEGKDKETLLDNAALRRLPPHEGVRVVYADGCRASPTRLKAAGVAFKQVPYEVRTN